MCLSPSDGFLFRDVVYDCINIKCLLSLLVYNLFGKCSYELLLENKVDLLGKQYLSTKVSRGRHCFENNYNDICAFLETHKCTFFFSIIALSKPGKNRVLSLASCRHLVSSFVVRTKSTDKWRDTKLGLVLIPWGHIVPWLVVWTWSSDGIVHYKGHRNWYLTGVMKYFAPNRRSSWRRWMSNLSLSLADQLLYVCIMDGWIFRAC